MASDNGHTFLVRATERRELEPKSEPATTGSTDEENTSVVGENGVIS